MGCLAKKQGLLTPHVQVNVRVGKQLPLHRPVLSIQTGVTLGYLYFFQKNSILFIFDFFNNLINSTATTEQNSIKLYNFILLIFHPIPI